MAMRLVRGTLKLTARVQATVGTQRKMGHIPGVAVPEARLNRKLTEPRIRVSTTVMVMTLFTRP